MIKKITRTVRGYGMHIKTMRGWVMNQCFGAESVPLGAFFWAETPFGELELKSPAFGDSGTGVSFLGISIGSLIGLPKPEPYLLLGAAILLDLLSVTELLFRSSEDGVLPPPRIFFTQKFFFGIYKSASLWTTGSSQQWLMLCDLWIYFVTTMGSP